MVLDQARRRVHGPGECAERGNHRAQQDQARLRNLEDLCAVQTGGLEGVAEAREELLCFLCESAPPRPWRSAAAQHAGVGRRGRRSGSSGTHPGSEQGLHCHRRRLLRGGGG